MIAELKGVENIAFTSDKVTITLSFDAFYAEDLKNTVNQITGTAKPFIVEISEQKKKRSLNANGYLWQLCNEIAKVVNSTKESVYRRAVEEVGVFEVWQIAASAVAKFNDVWTNNGLGWFTVPIDTDGEFTTLIVYYGSSSYSTDEMARLIDNTVAEAKELNIETLTPEELAKLKSLWGESN